MTCHYDGRLVAGPRGLELCFSNRAVWEAVR